MARVLAIALVFSAAAAGYLHLRADESATSLEPRAGAAAGDQAPDRAAAADVSHSLAPDEVSMPTAQSVDRWVADSQSANPSTRSAAILALADAPKPAAIAALRRVLEGGEPTTDRPLALQSLRDLALNQGDEDGTIRSVVRETIYHADDDQLVERAQLALEIIEESEME